MPSLDWIGKSTVVEHHNQVPFRLLKREPNLSVGDLDSGNLFVEGDNLEALKALLPYYAKQVKCIYIDPPYNTGNEHWVYNDNVNSPQIREWLGKVVGGEGEDMSRHDKWLCMMYPRLVLLHRLLREDGAIFISIDDNEVAHLRSIMDEIFGPQNFVATIIWHKIYAPKGSARHFSESHDYILVYAKNSVTWQRNLIPRTDKQDRIYKNRDNDPRGLWRPNNLAARNYYSLGTYSITTPSGRVISGPPKGSYWRLSKERLEEFDKEGRIWWGKKGNNVPAPKIYLTEVQQGVVPQTIWHYDEVGHTQEAKKEIVALLPDAEQVFITPKPTRLIQRILQLATDKDSLVLDSFAGSGTTGQAVLQQNKEDGGNRRFILVELEPEIARKITAGRLQRVIQGDLSKDQSENDNHAAGLGGGFDYCTLGPTLFDEQGRIRNQVTYGELAQHVFFVETGEPLPKRTNGKTPLLGTSRGIAIYLLYNGILADKSPNGGNALTRTVLASLPPFDGPKVIYGTSCRLGHGRLQAEGIAFKQIPYAIKVE